MKQRDALEALATVAGEGGDFGCWLANGMILHCEREGSMPLESGVLLKIKSQSKPSFFVWPAVLGFCSDELRREFQFAAQSRGMQRA